jgi:hypothetical protein
LENFVAATIGPRLQREGDMSEYTETVTATVAVLGVLGGMITFGWHTYEYMKKNALDRFNKFLVINKEFETDKCILKVRDAAEKKDWAGVTKDDKYYFMTFYEQLALMMQSKLIMKSIVFYYYGFELIRIYKDEKFWEGNDSKEDPFWRLFAEIYAQMTRYRDDHPDGKYPVKR